MNGNQLIGNKESAEGSSTFKAINPVSGETLAPAFHEATQDEINLIKLWINNSASQNTLIKDLPIPKKFLASFFPNKPNGIFPINNIPFVKNEI